MKKKLPDWVRRSLYIVPALVVYEIISWGIGRAGFNGLYPIILLGYGAVLYGYPSYRKSKEVDRELAEMVSGKVH